MPSNSLERRMKAIVEPESDRIKRFSTIVVEAGELMCVVQMATVRELPGIDLRDADFAHMGWRECLNGLLGRERRDGEA